MTTAKKTVGKKTIAKKAVAPAKGAPMEKAAAKKAAPAKKAPAETAAPARKTGAKKATAGRKYSPAASANVEREMKAMKQGKLRSSSGQKVTNPKQAIAIALSEARREGDELPADPIARCPAGRRGSVWRLQAAVRCPADSPDEGPGERLWLTPFGRLGLGGGGRGCRRCAGRRCRAFRAGTRLGLGWLAFAGRTFARLRLARGSGAVALGFR